MPLSPKMLCSDESGYDLTMVPDEDAGGARFDLNMAPEEGDVPGSEAAAAANGGNTFFICIIVLLRWKKVCSHFVFTFTSFTLQFQMQRKEDSIQMT